MLIIGLDDTDNLESRGTGHLARSIAADLAANYTVLGVTRHQLLVDPRVPCTRNNSSAAILLDGNSRFDLMEVARRVQALMLASFEPGSDPGLCVAHDVPMEVMQFGQRAKCELVQRSDACALAEAWGIPLLGLGGDQGGVIGALAAVGLAATGEDGRYVMVGRSRQLSGLQRVDALLSAGIQAVRTVDGQMVTEGLVESDKLRPARRRGMAIAVVEWKGDRWLPLKLD